MRVFCFPHAGGAPSVFFEWAVRLGQEFECVCIQLRGRGSRLHEKSHEAIVDIADEIAGNITGYLDVPFVFYGHSFGGVIAFELARRMKREGKQGPAHLFLGAVRPPHLAPPHAPIHALPEREFIDNVQGRYSGIPAAVLREPEILQFFLPALRADFTAYARSNEDVIAGWTWWAAGEPDWWDDVGANDGGHYSVTPTDGRTYTGDSVNMTMIKASF